DGGPQTRGVAYGTELTEETARPRAAVRRREKTRAERKPATLSGCGGACDARGNSKCESSSLGSLPLVEDSSLSCSQVARCSSRSSADPGLAASVLQTQLVPME